MVRSIATSVVYYMRIMLRSRNATNKQSHRTTSGTLWFVLSFCRSRNLEVAFSTSCEPHFASVASFAWCNDVTMMWHENTTQKNPLSQSFTTKISTLNLDQNLYTNCAATRETNQTSWTISAMPVLKTCWKLGRYRSGWNRIEPANRVTGLCHSKKLMLWACLSLCWLTRPIKTVRCSFEEN